MAQSAGEVRLIESWPEQEPVWLRQPPSPTGESYYFIGMSESAREEAAAKDLAVADALKKAAAYTGVSITAKSDRSTATNYQASGTADPTISDMANVMQSARAWFSRFVPEQWYVEHFGVVEKKMLGERFIEGEDFYRASVMLSIPTAEIENAVSEAKKRHDRAFDELVPMDDLKAEERDLLERVDKIKQHLNQMEANEKLKQKVAALERRIQLGIRNDDELNDIKSELQDSEKSIRFKVSGEGLFASALGEIDIRKQSMQAVDELLALAVTDGFDCDVDVSKIETEPSISDKSKVIMRIPISIVTRVDYVRRVIDTLRSFSNKGTGDKIRLVIHISEISLDPINISLPPDVVSYWYQGWKALRFRLIFKSEIGASLFATGWYTLDADHQRNVIFQSNVYFYPDRFWHGDLEIIVSPEMLKSVDKIEFQCE